MEIRGRMNVAKNFIVVKNSGEAVETD